MRNKPDGLAWFTKPEIALKQRVKDHYRNEKESEQRKIFRVKEERKVIYLINCYGDFICMTYVT